MNNSKNHNLNLSFKVYKGEIRKNIYDKIVKDIDIKI